MQITTNDVISINTALNAINNAITNETEVNNQLASRRRDEAGSSVLTTILNNVNITMFGTPPFTFQIFKLKSTDGSDQVNDLSLESNWWSPPSLSSDVENESFWFRDNYITLPDSYVYRHGDIDNWHDSYRDLSTMGYSVAFNVPYDILISVDANNNRVKTNIETEYYYRYQSERQPWIVNSFSIVPLTIDAVNQTISSVVGRLGDQFVSYIDNDNVNPGLYIKGSHIYASPSVAGFTDSTGNITMGLNTSGQPIITDGSGQSILNNRDINLRHIYIMNAGNNIIGRWDGDTGNLVVNAGGGVILNNNNIVPTSATVFTAFMQLSLSVS